MLLATRSIQAQHTLFTLLKFVDVSVPSVLMFISPKKIYSEVAVTVRLSSRWLATKTPTSSSIRRLTAILQESDGSNVSASPKPFMWNLYGSGSQFADATEPHRLNASTQDSRPSPAAATEDVAHQHLVTEIVLEVPTHPSCGEDVSEMSGGVESYVQESQGYTHHLMLTICQSET